MADTSIEWTDKTWSPIRARVKEDAWAIALDRGWTDLLPIVSKMASHVGPHCEMCSPGCNHCYSLTNNGRLLPNNGTGLPFDKRSRELVDIFVDEKILTQPLHWKKPQRIFVENQSDLFGEWVPFEYIDKVFAVMALCSQHTFQVLTKRADRMQEYCSSNDSRDRIVKLGLALMQGIHCTSMRAWENGDGLTGFVMQNVWLGVSAEDQKRADERILPLIQTPAMVRFVSYEPALGPIEFTRLSGLDWIIVGGESGPNARPFNVQWARDVVRQCKAARVACFVKQLGARPQVPRSRQAHWEWGEQIGRNALFFRSKESSQMWNIKLKSRKGGDLEEFPLDLRVREYP